MNNTPYRWLEHGGCMIRTGDGRVYVSIGMLAAVVFPL